MDLCGNDIDNSVFKSVDIVLATTCVKRLLLNSRKQSLLNDFTIKIVSIITCSVTTQRRTQQAKCSSN